MNWRALEVKEWFCSVKRLENIEKASGVILGGIKDQFRAFSRMTRALLRRDMEGSVRISAGNVEDHIILNDILRAYQTPKMNPSHPFEWVNELEWALCHIGGKGLFGVCTSSNIQGRTSELTAPNHCSTNWGCWFTGWRNPILCWRGLRTCGKGKGWRGSLCCNTSAELIKDRLLAIIRGLLVVSTGVWQPITMSPDAKKKE